MFSITPIINGIPDLLAAINLESGDMKLIGRSDKCDMIIHDQAASRIHCRVFSRQGKVFLTDASSRWGTFVNGQKIQNIVLTNGDEIKIGDTILKVEYQQDGYSTTLAPLGNQKALSQEHFVSIPENINNQHKVAVVQLQSFLSPEKFLNTDFLGYHIESIIHSSNKGLIFKAINKENNLPVVLKIFHPAFLHSEVDLQRLNRSLNSISELNHSHLASLISAGNNQSYHYCLHEFVPGKNVQQVIQKIGIANMLEWKFVYSIAQQLLDVLKYLHEQHIIYRNLVPRHIMLDEVTQQVKLCDLLLVREIDNSNGNLTNPGEILGELPYQSIEQLIPGLLIDQRTDLYQLGCTLYSLLTGKPPYLAINTAELIEKIKQNDIIPISKFNLAVPQLFEDFVMKLLQKHPEARFQNAPSAQEELTRIFKYC